MGGLPSVLRLQDLERISMRDVVYRPIRKAMGVSAFGINAYTADKAGEQVIEAHDETGPGSGKHEELYLVVTGRADFELDGEVHDVGPGTLVFARPEQHRGAKATADDTTIVVLGGVPGAAGPPSPFEYWYFAEPARAAGDFQRAYEICAEGLEHYPDNVPMNYNLACYAGMAGRLDDAVRHFEVALAADPERVRTWAADDPEIDPIRDRLRL